MYFLACETKHCAILFKTVLLVLDWSTRRGRWRSGKGRPREQEGRREGHTRLGLLGDRPEDEDLPRRSAGLANSQHPAEILRSVGSDTAPIAIQPHRTARSATQTRRASLEFFLRTTLLALVVVHINKLFA